VLHPAHGMLKLWDQKPEVGMLFGMRLDMQNHGYSFVNRQESSEGPNPEWERHYYRHLYFVVTARHRVYGLKTGEHDWKKVPPAHWRNLSNHDSEWRGGFDLIDKTHTEAWDHCFRSMPDDHRPKNYYEPQPFTSPVPGIAGNNVLNFVVVEREPWTTSDNPNPGYFDKLTKITPIKFRIELEGIA
jgi:hypothetical protein